MNSLTKFLAKADLSILSRAASFGGAATLLLAGALVIAPAPASAQKSKTLNLDALNLKLPETGTAPKPIVDDQTCKITPEMGMAWIEQSVQMTKLRDAYKETIDNWASLDINLFGHAAVSNKPRYKDDALAAVHKSAADLVKLAQQYAGRQTKSCDVCYQLRDWGILWEVSARMGTTGELRKSGSFPIQVTSAKPTITPLNVPFVVRDLTQNQVQNPEVLSSAGDFLTAIVLHDKAAPDPFEISPTSEAYKKNEQICRQAGGDAQQCTQSMLKAYMRVYADNIYDALSKLPKNDNSARMLSLWNARAPACEPRFGTPYDDFTPISWIRTPRQ